MKINSKRIEDISEKDLLEIEEKPIFEDMQVEFKYDYDNNPDELRKDVIQFANSINGGIIFYGARENPLKFVGLEYKSIDKIKNTINNILPRKIDPVLSPFPTFEIIELSNGKFVLCIIISPKENGIYAIRLSDNPSKSEFNTYEFYTRLDGSKHLMKIEEIVNLIEAKSKGTKKFLDVSILPGVITEADNMRNIYISIKAVNKGVRQIVITAYGLKVVKYGTIIDTYLEKLLRKNLCDRLPKKLLDGDACRSLYPRKIIDSTIKDLHWEYPLEVKAFFNTNDGIFFSEPIKLINLSKY